MVRSLLFQANLPPPSSYWAEALHVATLFLNVLPTSRIPSHLTPFEALYHRPYDYSQLRVFGCLCYPNLAATAAHKLAPRSTPFVFLCYPQSHRGFRCLDLSSGKLIISRHVIFDKSIVPFSSTHLSSPSPIMAEIDESPLLPLSPSPAVQSPVAPPLVANPPAQPSSPTTHAPPIALGPTPPSTVPSSPPPPTGASPAAPPIPTHRMTTRSKVDTFKPKIPFSLSLTSSTLSLIPRTYSDTLRDPHWRDAMLGPRRILFHAHPRLLCCFWQVDFQA